MGKQADEHFSDVALEPKPVVDAAPWSPFGALQACYEYALLIVGFGFMGSASFLLSVAAIILQRVLPRRVAHTFGQRAITAIFRGLMAIMRASRIVKFDISELDRLRGEGPLVIAPNHPSMLDAVMVIGRLSNVVCVMKEDIHGNPCLGGGARLAGYVGNDTLSGMVKASVEALQDGRQLLMFPEGTRTIAQPVNELKGSFAIVAKQARVPIQTVIMQSNTDFLSKGWSIFRKPEFPLVYRARLGQRFVVGNDTRACLTEIEAYFRRELGVSNKLFGPFDILGDIPGDIPGEMPGEIPEKRSRARITESE